MADLIDVSLVSDVLTVGAVGFVFGVILPFGFRVVGYVVDSVKVIVEG